MTTISILPIPKCQPTSDAGTSLPVSSEHPLRRATVLPVPAQGKPFEKQASPENNPLFGATVFIP